MKNRFFKAVIIILLINSHILYSQTTGGIVTGVVKELATGITMPGVNVVIEGLSGEPQLILTASLKLRNSPGKYNLVLTFISYKTIVVEGGEIKPGAVSEVTLR